MKKTAKKLVRLAYENESLRCDLLPIISKMSSSRTSSWAGRQREPEYFDSGRIDWSSTIGDSIRHNFFKHLKGPIRAYKTLTWNRAVRDVRDGRKITDYTSWWRAAILQELRSFELYPRGSYDQEESYLHDRVQKEFESGKEEVIDQLIEDFFLESSEEFTDFAPLRSIKPDLDLLRGEVYLQRYAGLSDKNFFLKAVEYIDSKIRL